MWPLIAARSDPQMPLRFGITRTQSRAGRGGSATSPSLSIDSALVATGGRLQVAGQTPVLEEQMRAVHLDVKQLRQRLHDHIERSCEQQNAVAGALVLPDPPHAFGIDAAKGHRVERLAAKSLHHLRVEPVVLAIEAALKLRSRASLQEEPARPFAKHVRHEGGPVLEWLRAEAHPQEALHDVGLDERSVDDEP